MRFPPVVRHALLVVAGYAALFCWVFWTPLRSATYMAEGDLYDWFLPIFLSPIRQWSHEMFAGVPLFADTSDSQAYVVHFFFAHVVRSWTGYIISGFVIAASCMYAYAYALTRLPAAAALAGIAYSLAPTLLERQAHINIVHGTAWFPLVMLALDRVIAGGSRRWIAVGAFALANTLLSGHPQPVIYVASAAAIYAVVGGLAEHASLRTYLRAAAVFVLGALLTFVKALPFVEVSRYMARTELTYEWFVTPEQSALQMLGILLPAASGTDVPIHLALATIALGFVAVVSRQYAWRVRYWMAATVVALLLTAGSLTPLAYVAFHLPLYGKFRIISRALFIAAAGAAALSAFALSDIREKRVSARAVWRSVAVSVALWAAGGAALVVAREDAAATGTAWAPQMALALVTCGTLVWIAGARRFTMAAAILAAVVAADLLYNNTRYPVSAAGLRVDTLPAAYLEPSVHARRLNAAITPEAQRVLAVGGTSRDPVVPPGFARLWGIATAGGYSPVMLARLAALAGMGAPGDVYPETLAFENRSLDLLAVRYLLVREHEFPDPERFTREGVAFAEPSLEYAVGRSDCGAEYPRQAALQAPPGTVVTSVVLVAYLRCAEMVPQGATVATVRVAGDGAEHEMPLLAGVHIADRSLGNPANGGDVKHAAAPAFDDPDLVYASRVRIDLPTPMTQPRMTVAVAPLRGWLTIERVTFLDAAGVSRPQTLGPLLLADAQRWRQVTRFRTSRRSDRGADEDAAGEQGIAIYENLRALPRAWVVDETIELSERDALDTVRYSQLPDGRPFDPARMALVDPGAGRQRFAAGRATARVTGIADGRITVDVSAPGGGYLVLSEAHYPGWRARVSGTIVPVQRTNVLLQGVAVPPGDHTVVFELASWTLRLGLATTLLAVAVAAIILWKG